MAQFKDVLPSTQGWIHELAKAEIHPEAEKLLQLGGALDPQQMVEESTVDFLSGLREHFTDFARIFNSYAEAGRIFQEIKIYSVAQTAADFMVFRNQVKLLFTNTAHGVIQISFAQHQRAGVLVDGQSTSALDPKFAQPQELLAQVGPFRNIFWAFQSEKVAPDQVAKFYFGEFIRASRDTRRSKLSNQLLLEQVKALLEQKGIEL